MPAKSEKQRRFMGAELARKRAGEETHTDMSEAKLGEFASKEFVMKDTLDFIDNYIKKAPYYDGLGFVADNETKPIRRIRRIHPSEPSDKEIRERLKRVHETRRAGVWPDGPSIGVPSTLTDKELLARAKVKENTARRRGDYDAYHAIEAIKAGGAPRREEITQTAALNEVQTRPNAASQQRVAANIDASKERTAADNAARVEVSKMNHQDFASQLDKHINHLEKRHTYTHEEARESFDRDAAKVISERQRKRDAELRRERGLPSNNLEKRHRKGMSHTEAREFFDRDAAKVMSGRQRKRDAELRRERGLPSDNSVTHVDRSVKFRDLEKQKYTHEESRESFDRMAEKEQRQRDFDDDNRQRRERGKPEKSVTHVDRSVKFRDLEKQKYTPEESRESFDRMAEKKQRQRDFEHDKELRRKRGESEKPVTHIDRSVKFRDLETNQAAIASNKAEANIQRAEENVDIARRVVVKSKIVDNKYLLPAQDSNGNMIPNDTIPFTQETNQLMSLAADAIEKYVMKDYADDNEVDTKAARRNKRKANKRKMRVTGAGNKDSLRMIGKRAAQTRGEEMD